MTNLWIPEGIDYDVRRYTDGYVQPQQDVQVASQALTLSEVTLRGGEVASEIAIERHEFTDAHTQHAKGQYAVFTEKSATADGVVTTDYLTTNVSDEISSLMVVKTTSKRSANLDEIGKVTTQQGQAATQVSNEAVSVSGATPTSADLSISQQDDDLYYVPDFYSTSADIEAQNAAILAQNQANFQNSISTGSVQSSTGNTQQTYQGTTTGTQPLQTEENYGYDPYWSYLDPYSQPASTNDPYGSLGGSLGF